MTILSYDLRSGKVSSARFFPGSSTHISTIFFLDLKLPKPLVLFFVACYNCTHDSTLEFHLELKLYQMRQDSGSTSRQAAGDIP
uniref:Uncharacterized protein n=1 Tax=Fagus sylvatica TaxID=28930 RepID=A0A2N9HNL0_FAGSY